MGVIFLAHTVRVSQQYFGDVSKRNYWIFFLSKSLFGAQNVLKDPIAAESRHVPCWGCTYCSRHSRTQPAAHTLTIPLVSFSVPPAARSLNRSDRLIVQSVGLYSLTTMCHPTGFRAPEPYFSRAGPKQHLKWHAWLMPWWIDAETPADDDDHDEATMRW